MLYEGSSDHFVKSFASLVTDFDKIFLTSMISCPIGPTHFLTPVWT